MKKYSATNPEELRSLCIQNDWFTCGTISQYDKLFYANENGCPIEEIATIIWLCSDEECRRADVLEILIRAHQNHILNVIDQCGYRRRLLTTTVEEVYNGIFEEEIDGNPQTRGRKENGKV